MTNTPECVEQSGVFLTETPSDLMFNLMAMRSSEAQKLWFQKIREVWDNRCAYCGTPPIDSNSLTRDHVKPRSRGGETRLRNVIPACKRCNQSKRSHPWREWYRTQPCYSAEREERIDYWLEHGELPMGDVSQFSEYVNRMAA